MEPATRVTERLSGVPDDHAGLSGDVAESDQELMPGIEDQGEGVEDGRGEEEEDHQDCVAGGDGRAHASAAA